MLKVTKLVDTETQAVLDVYCSTTRKGRYSDLAEQNTRRNAGDLPSLVADKGMISSRSAKHYVNSASDR